MIFENFAAFISKIMAFSAFISTANGFPKPLEPAEEKELFKRFKEGDEEAKNKLINHNLRLVTHIVKKFSSAGEADDLISVGTIGLIKGINTYEEGKGSQLSTYAARCIENEILMLLRTTKKHRQVASLHEALGTDKDGNEIELIDVIASAEEELEEVISKSLLRDKMEDIIKNNLNEREQQIIKLRYGIGNASPLPQREVAIKLGISRSYISRLEKKALQIIEGKVKQHNLL